MSSAGPHIQAENIALHEEPGEYDFYQCRTGQLSSIFKPNYELINKYPQPERYDIVETLQIKMTSLDRFFQGSAVPGPHFIKLDTQGSELAILRGSSRVLQHTVGVELEVEHVPLYKEAPLFPEVDSFMRDQGFVLYDLYHSYWSRLVPEVGFDASLGDLIFSDVLYFRPPESVLELSRGGGLTVDHAVRCYLAYGYTHLSYALITRAAADGLLDQDSFNSLQDLIKECQGPRVLSWLPGGQVMRWRLVHLADWLFPWSGWARKSKGDLGSRYGTR